MTSLATITFLKYGGLYTLIQMQTVPSAHNLLKVKCQLTIEKTQWYRFIHKAGGADGCRLGPFISSFYCHKQS